MGLESIGLWKHPPGSIWAHYHDHFMIIVEPKTAGSIPSDFENILRSQFQPTMIKYQLKPIWVHCDKLSDPEWNLALIHNTYITHTHVNFWPPVFKYTTHNFFTCVHKLHTCIHMYTHVKYITSTQLFVLFVFLLLFLLDQNL